MNALSSYKDQSGKQHIAYIVDGKAVMSLPARLNNMEMPSLKEAAVILSGKEIPVAAKAKAKAGVFTFTHDDGRIAKRTSKTRAYTHVIVGHSNLAALRTSAASKGAIEGHKSNWAYAVECAKVQPGEMYEGYRFIVDQSMHDKGLALLALYGNESAYVAACIARAIERINEQGSGNAGPEVVLQWSMSGANAAKGTSGWNNWHVGIAVKPVDQTAA